jgi:diamine N-acetyltransferase
VTALSELARRTWADSFGSSVSPDVASAALDETRSESYFVDALRRQTILVLEQNDTLLGYVQFGDVDIPEVEARPGDGELHRVYVETGLQGQGSGRRLVNAALDHPRLADADRVYLQVWEQNERAIRLYERLGFEVVGTTTFSIGGTIAEDLVMVLNRRG